MFTITVKFGIELKNPINFPMCESKSINLHTKSQLLIGIFGIHSKITMAGDVVPYYTVTALVPTLK